MLTDSGHAKTWNTTAASRQLARPMAWEVSSMGKAGQLPSSHPSARIIRKRTFSGAVGG